MGARTASPPSQRTNRKNTVSASRRPLMLIGLVAGLLTLLLFLAKDGRSNLAALPEVGRGHPPDREEVIASTKAPDAGRSATGPSTFAASLDLLWHTQKPAPSNSNPVRILLLSESRSDAIT